MALHKTMGFLLVMTSMAASGTALFADQPLPGMQFLIDNLFNPIKNQVKADRETQKFIDANTNSIVIANESAKAWTFALVPQQAGARPAGTLLVKELRNDRQTYYAEVKLGPGGETTYPIRANFGTIVITPVRVHKGWSGWEDFATHCYLEDDRGHRLFFNLARGGEDPQPTFGFTRAVKDPVIELSYLELKNMFAIKMGNIPGPDQK